MAKTLQKSISISIEYDAEFQLIRDAYLQKVSNYQAEIQRMTAEIENLKDLMEIYQNKIKQLDKPDNDDSPELAVKEFIVKQSKLFEDTYSPGITKAAQAEYVLRITGKPASTREILEFLLSKDPELLTRNNTTFDKYQKALAATLFQKAAAKNTFRSIRQENSEGVKYGLIEM